MGDIRFLLGVDGGGTHCRVALATMDGALIGRANAGSANITTNLDDAYQNIMAAVGEAYGQAGLPNEAWGETAAWLGLAGANVGNAADGLNARLPFAISQVDGDAPIALQGALHEGDGAIAILGTGSAFLSRRAGVLKLIGGWGYQLSDIGGGARIGRDALELALLAHDGMATKSPLVNAIMTEFSAHPDNLVVFAKTARPGDFGRFTPMVITHAASGEEQAVAILQNAGAMVDRAFDALCDEDTSQIALLGGLAPHFAPYLAERHREKLITPRANALTGAVELAGKIARGEQPARGGR